MFMFFVEFDDLRTRCSTYFKRKKIRNETNNKLEKKKKNIDI